MSRGMVLLVIAVTLGASLGAHPPSDPALGATPVPKACCPAPAPAVHVDLYRHVGTGWVRARRLHLGDRLLLVLLFRWNPRPYVDSTGWDTPSARLVIRRDQYPYTDFRPHVGHQGVLYVSPPLPRRRLPNRYNRFHIEVDVPRHASRWRGRLQVEFEVTNGTAQSGFYISPAPTVLPALPG